jgi:hypothetical protein
VKNRWILRTQSYKLVAENRLITFIISDNENYVYIFFAE